MAWQDLSDGQLRNKARARESKNYWDGAREVSDMAQGRVNGLVVCLPIHTAENGKVGKLGTLMLSTTRDNLRRIGRFVADRSNFDHFPQQDVIVIWHDRGKDSRSVLEYPVHQQLMIT
jgi:hypothetical protein